MVIKVNGENLNLEKSLNIAELLMAVKAAQPEYVTVQLNGEFVERDDFPKIFVNDTPTKFERQKFFKYLREFIFCRERRLQEQRLFCRSK